MSTQFFPLLSQRTPSATYFAEIFFAAGPETLVGGSAQLPTIPWLVCVDEQSRIVELHQWQEDSQGWLRVEDPDHPLIGREFPAAARRLSLSFDQTEHPIVAYELNNEIRVTRWDIDSNSYVQNVTFPGVDPVVFFDAAVAEAGAYRLELIVEWLPSGQWFTPDQVIADSDVLVFYLSSDRLRLMCRVQRQLFQTPIELFEFDQPVILDRVVAADGRYQALISDAAGRAMPEALVSAPYIGDRALLARHADDLAAGVTLEPVRVQSNTYLAGLTEGIAAGVELEAIRIGQNTYIHATSEQLTAGVGLEAIRVGSSVYVHRPAPEPLDAAVELEDIEVRVSVIPHAAEPEGINAGVSLEAIRVQKIA